MVEAKTKLAENISKALKEFYRADVSARIKRGIEFAKKQKRK